MVTEHLNKMVLRTTGEGDSILWLHGLGESSLCFENFIKSGSLSRFRHHLLDLPGYGRAAHDEPLSLEELARKLDPVLRRIGRSFLVGHSMGGVLAVLAVEALGSEYVRGVINVEGNLSLGDCEYSGRVTAYSQEEYQSEGRGRLLDELYQRGLTDPAHRGYFVSMSLAQPSMVYQHSLDLVRLSRSERMVSRMEALEVPVLYVAGTPHGICSHSRQLLQASLVDHRQIENSGHWPFLDRPEACVESLQPWLGKVCG